MHHISLRFHRAFPFVAFVMTLVAIFAVLWTGISMLPELTGSLIHNGVKGGVEIVTVEFNNGEIYEPIDKNTLAIAITPIAGSQAAADFSAGAPMELVLPIGNKWIAYRYGSQSADAERNAFQSVSNGHPMTFTELFSGQFFASRTELASGTMASALAAKYGMTFHEQRDVLWDTDARYIVSVIDDGVFFTARGLAWCGDGAIQAPEACDDANDIRGDGCTECIVDLGHTCTGEPSYCGPTLQQCSDTQDNDRDGFIDEPGTFSIITRDTGNNSVLGVTNPPVYFDEAPLNFEANNPEMRSYYYAYSGSPAEFGLKAYDTATGQEKASYDVTGPQTLIDEVHSTLFSIEQRPDYNPQYRSFQIRKAVLHDPTAPILSLTIPKPSGYQYSPETVVLSDDGLRMYVVLKELGQVQHLPVLLWEIDTSTMTVLRELDLNFFTEARYQLYYDGLRGKVHMMEYMSRVQSNSNPTYALPNRVQSVDLQTWTASTTTEITQDFRDSDLPIYDAQEGYLYLLINPDADQGTVLTDIVRVNLAAVNDVQTLHVHDGSLFSFDDFDLGYNKVQLSFIGFDASHDTLYALRSNQAGNTNSRVYVQAFDVSGAAMQIGSDISNIPPILYFHDMWPQIAYFDSLRSVLYFGNLATETREWMALNLKTGDSSLFDTYELTGNAYRSFVVPGASTDKELVLTPASAGSPYTLYPSVHIHLGEPQCDTAADDDESQ